VTPQRRGASKRDWPANLYERNGYFSWRHPVTRKEYGIGRDKFVALNHAIAANLHVAGQATATTLVDRLDGSSKRTVDAWCDRYEKQLAKRELAENTRRTYKSLLKRTRAALGGANALARVTTLVVSDALDAVQEEGKSRLAQAWRSFLTDFFRAAVAAGWIETNPALVTEKVKVEVQRARLTFDDFQALYAAADLPWLKNAMALALVSAQRREDVARATFADFREGGWWCEQRKTGNRVFLPLELRITCFGLSLADVLKQCRSTGVLSKHLIHQVRPRGNSPVGNPIWQDTITRQFGELVANLGRDWGDQMPPTFHEIRSLSERLYSDQGGVNTQELLGHRDPRMTQTYHDSRGAEWVKVKLA